MVCDVEHGRHRESGLTRQVRYPLCLGYGGCYDHRADGFGSDQLTTTKVAKSGRAAAHLGPVLPAPLELSRSAQDDGDAVGTMQRFGSLTAQRPVCERWV